MKVDMPLNQNWILNVSDPIDEILIRYNRSWSKNVGNGFWPLPRRDGLYGECLW